MRNMFEEKIWHLDMDEYIRQSEPEKIEKAGVWQAAMGLQTVDGLTTSEYLSTVAREHIEGKISIDEVWKKIWNHYEKNSNLTDMENGTKEADFTAARIAQLLGEKTFQFSSAEFLLIHKRLFDGTFVHAGQVRTYNIIKKERILDGNTLTYASWNSIKELLDYHFEIEKQFRYEGLTLEESVSHFAKFASDIWQIHPFCKGNTRTTAVFIIKYMQAFGFEIDYQLFEKYSLYFRNALVRANYTNLKDGIYATTAFLEHFFENLALGTEYALKNEDMGQAYKGQCKSDKEMIVTFENLKFHDENVTFKEEIQMCQKQEIKCQKEEKYDTLMVTSDERIILNEIKKNPVITQAELAEQIGKSVRTVKREMTQLKEKGYICRLNGKRDGKWEVLVDVF